MRRTPEYLFATWMKQQIDAAAELIHDLDVAEPILELGTPAKWRFFVGPQGSGTLPHSHHSAIHAILSLEPVASFGVELFSFPEDDDTSPRRVEAGVRGADREGAVDRGAGGGRYVVGLTTAFRLP